MNDIHSKTGRCYFCEDSEHKLGRISLRSKTPEGVTFILRTYFVCKRCWAKAYFLRHLNRYGVHGPTHDELCKLMSEWIRRRDK